MNIFQGLMVLSCFIGAQACWSIDYLSEDSQMVNWMKDYTLSEPKNNLLKPIVGPDKELTQKPQKPPIMPVVSQFQVDNFTCSHWKIEKKNQPFENFKFKNWKDEKPNKIKSGCPKNKPSVQKSFDISKHLGNLPKKGT